jgi:hypothetical protein
MDATPLFDFALNAVNIMNNTGQTAQHPGYVSGFNTNIVGKYFVEDDMAYRVKIGINTTSTKNTFFFDNQEDVFNGVAEPGEISDVSKTSSMDIFLAGGLEYRRGHNRLQGYYGGEAGIAFMSGKTVNTWAVAQDNNAATNGYQNNDGSLVSAPRPLTSKVSPSFGFGVRGFIGAEFGWGLGIMTSGRSYAEVESWNFADSVSEVTEAEGNKSSTFGFAVDNGMTNLFGASAALTLNLHF